MKHLNLAIALMGAAMLREEFDATGMASGVDSFSNPNKDIMSTVLKEEEEREFNEKKNAAKLQIQVDRYNQEKEAIVLRKDRAINDAMATRLKKRSEENAKYLAGGIDTEVHKKNLEALDDEYNKAVSKAQSDYAKAFSNLKTKNPEGYRRSEW